MTGPSLSLPRRVVAPAELRVRMGGHDHACKGQPPDPWEDPKSRNFNFGLQYSYGVDSRTLRWIYFLGSSQGLRLASTSTVCKTTAFWGLVQSLGNCYVRSGVAGVCFLSQLMLWSRVGKTASAIHLCLQKAVRYGSRTGSEVVTSSEGAVCCLLGINITRTRLRCFELLAHEDVGCSVLLGLGGAGMLPCSRLQLSWTFVVPRGLA